MAKIYWLTLEIHESGLPRPPKSMLGDGMSYHGPGTNIDLGERGLCRFGGLSQYFWPWLSEWGSFLLYPIWKLTSKFSGPMFTILSVSLDKPLMGPRWKTKHDICVIQYFTRCPWAILSPSFEIKLRGFQMKKKNKRKKIINQPNASEPQKWVITHYSWFFVLIVLTQFDFEFFKLKI